MPSYAEALQNAGIRFQARKTPAVWRGTSQAKRQMGPPKWGSRRKRIEFPLHVNWLCCFLGGTTHHDENNHQKHAVFKVNLCPEVGFAHKCLQVRLRHPPGRAASLRDPLSPFCRSRPIGVRSTPRKARSVPEPLARSWVGTPNLKRPGRQPRRRVQLFGTRF